MQTISSIICPSIIPPPLPPKKYLQDCVGCGYPEVVIIYTNM